MLEVWANMSVNWKKQDGASGAKHGWDMGVLYGTNYDPPRYIGHEM